MILIYTHKLTNRFKYVTDLIFNSVLNIPFEITDEREAFLLAQKPKLAYTTEEIASPVFIYSENLLFETGIKQIIPQAEKEYSNYPKFFANSKSDFLGYDLFAMVFYFATRYEEYIKTEIDKHQRFKAENSIAYSYNCLQIPFLNEAILDFSEKLKQKFPELNFKKRDFNFTSTIDIDNAFAYANKGFKRNVGGFFKDLFSLKIKQSFTRISSIINQEKDPYNTYKLINELSKQVQLNYFVLIGDYSDYDKNPHFKNKGFKELLIKLSNSYNLGLHPSYYCYKKEQSIKLEQQRLQNILNKNITSARCHFLRVNLPTTYREFIKNGITDDFTMIYASQCGFRTGLCIPFKWYDIEHEEVTNLTIHTSIVMEGILRDYNGLNLQDSKILVEKLMHEVKKHGGEFISIFHNDSFTAQNTDWIELYKHILKTSLS